MSSSVVVVGSFNVDHVWRCESLPAPGATAETDTANGGLNLHGGSNDNVCGLSVSGAVNNTVTGTDDLEYNPANGHYYTTMMGAGGSFSATGTTALSLPPVLTTPGGLPVPSTSPPAARISSVPRISSRWRSSRTSAVE